MVLTICFLLCLLHSWSVIFLNRCNLCGISMFCNESMSPARLGFVDPLPPMHQLFHNKIVKNDRSCKYVINVLT